MSNKNWDNNNNWGSNEDWDNNNTSDISVQEPMPLFRFPSNQDESQYLTPNGKNILRNIYKMGIAENGPEEPAFKLEPVPASIPTQQDIPAPETFSVGSQPTEPEAVDETAQFFKQVAQAFEKRKAETAEKIAYYNKNGWPTYNSGTDTNLPAAPVETVQNALLVKRDGAQDRPDDILLAQARDRGTTRDSSTGLYPQSNAEQVIGSDPAHGTIEAFLGKEAQAEEKKKPDPVPEDNKPESRPAPQKDPLKQATAQQRADKANEFSELTKNVIQAEKTLKEAEEKKDDELIAKARHNLDTCMKQLEKAKEEKRKALEAVLPRHVTEAQARFTKAQNEFITNQSAEAEKELSDATAALHKALNSKEMKRIKEHIEDFFHPNVAAFLGAISECGGKTNYDTKFAYKKIEDYATHPGAGVNGQTASGRYQIQTRTWEGIKGTWKGVGRRLNLPDFSPESQDISAMEILRQEKRF